MSQPTAERKTMEVLAEEFVTRYRRGERPSLAEYIASHPDLADEIRELFPTLVMMEELAPSDSGESIPSAASPSAEPSLPLLGDYRILREIGRGGMGIVYEAEQLSLGRRVALKVLPRHVAGDVTVRQRFQREARAAARLHHTNIVPVFEVGENTDACWYAMQLILGQGLDQVIEELRPRRRPPGERTDVPPRALSQVTQALVNGQFECPLLDVGTPSPSRPSDSPAAETPVPPDVTDPIRAVARSELSAAESAGGQYYRSVARIGRQAAEGLAYAHARGIVHRDVKPSNLLLDMAGVVWITDFGLAKTQDSALTTTGDVVGTLRYMAPERFRGEVDERADVYGLGLTLYELLVLRPAFPERDRLALIEQIKNREPPRPRALDRRVPRDLETIVLKAIHKEARRRYPTAEAMADDLRRFLADEPIKARRTGELERLRLWGRRNPLSAALSASLFLLLALVAAGATAAAVYLRATLDDSEANRRRAEKAEREGQEKLWLSYLAQARARRMSRQPGQCFASLRAVKEALALPVPPGHSRDELRTEALAALCLPDLEILGEVGTEQVGWGGFAADPALERFAVADREGRVSLRRLSDGEVLLRLPGGGPVNPYTGLEFSPEGRYLYQRCETGSGDRSRLWDLTASPPRPVLDDSCHHLAFSPDGRQFAAGYPDRTLRLFETATGRELRRFTVPGAPAGFALHWNPCQPQLLLVAPAFLALLDLDTGKTSALGLKPAGVSSADWHPEGRLLAVGCFDLKIYLWDVASGRLVLPPLEGHTNGGISVKFNRAGDCLYSTDWSSRLNLWEVSSGRLVLSTPAFGPRPRFSADDRRVASGETGKARLSRGRVVRELCRMVHRSGTAFGRYRDPGSVRTDPEGRLVAVNTDDGIAVVDVVRHEEVGLLPLPVGNMPVCFEPDGSLWTGGPAGLLRWPCADGPEAGHRRYGLPRRMLNRTPYGRHDVSRDRRVVAIPNFVRGALVFDPEQRRMAPLSPQEDVRGCSVSPDGRWVATGSHELHHGSGAKVWDAATGRLVADLPVPGVCEVRFSPDGKWLLTGGGGCRLWAAGTWQEGPKLGPAPHGNSGGNFSADGKLLALGGEPGVLRLVVPDTGAELARLTAPEQTPLYPCSFTPDGGRLIAFGTDTSTLYVFDLRALRAGLAELDLDWDAPPLPAAPARPAKPLRVTFDMGDLLQVVQGENLVEQAARHVRANEPHKALAALRRAVQVAPRHAPAHNNLAWLLLTGPEELRDPAQALTSARRAVELAGASPAHLNTLGVALYRTGQLAEAVPMLERSLNVGKGRADAYDLFFLAMCHHRLGDAEKAEECRRRAAEWFQARRDKLTAEQVGELTAFHAEAGAVLAQPKK